MATRSNIAYKDGEIYHAQYCHYDGYIDGVGKILHNYYNSFDKAKELVNGGSMSSLEKSISETPFHKDGVGYDESVFSSFDEMKSYFLNNIEIEYLYYFEDEKWNVIFFKYDTDGYRKYFVNDSLEFFINEDNVCNIL